jgi:hypothetical protein
LPEVFGVNEVELSDEELSLPNQESRLQPSSPELALGPMLEASPPALSRRSLRFCTRFISRQQISDVPPDRHHGMPVTPLIIVFCVQGVEDEPLVSAHRSLPSVPFSSPRDAWPFIDRSSEMWNFWRDKT